MDVCLGLALSSVLLARLPSPVTLSWQHSVEHVALAEEWVADERGLVLREAAVEGPGAGIDLPSDARWLDGRWRFTPALPPQQRVSLANSRFAAGYRLCWPGGCAKLADLAGGVDRPVTMSACR
jgi:hypothetical protein